MDRVILVDDNGVGLDREYAVGTTARDVLSVNPPAAELKEFKGALRYIGDIVVPSGRYTLVPGAAGQPPRAETAMAALRRHVPDAAEDVLACVLRYHSRRLDAAQTAADFQNIYEDALQLPRTTARVHVLSRDGLAINGTFRPDVISRSTLLHAFRSPANSSAPVPMILKISIDSAAMRHEAHVWTELQAQDSPHLVPNELVDLRANIEDRGRATHGVLMPLLPVTMESIPRPIPLDYAVHIIQDITEALDVMHKKLWAHNDVKASNIFIGKDGTALLGDYGSAQPLGEDAGERTLSHQLHCSEAIFDLYKSTVACDKAQLALTILLHLGALPHRPLGHDLADVRQAAHGPFLNLGLFESLNKLLPRV